MEKEKTLGETLKALRTQAGITQSELGEQLSISAQAISKWERDESQPDIETLKKLAEIYGVSVAEIIEPENSASRENNEGEITSQAERKTASVFDGLYDLYLTGDFENNRIRVVYYIKEKFNIGLAEAKDIAYKYPYALTGGATAEEADMLEAYFAEYGVKIAREPSRGQVPRRPLITAEVIEERQREAEKDKKYLKKRFIVANITAAIPAIVAMILMIINRETFWGNALVGVYGGLCTYALIFLLWYPSIIREAIGFIFDLGAELNGCILFLPKILLTVALLAVTFLLSPVIYAFSIGRRISRMKAGDMRDNIFIDDKNFIDY